MSFVSNPCWVGWPGFRRALLTGTALAGPIVLASVAVSTPALANCTQSGSTVTCAPPGTGGFVAGQNGLTVTVQSGTTVTDNGTAAITVNNTSSVTNNGTIAAAAGTIGISGLSNLTIRNDSLITTGQNGNAIVINNDNGVVNTGAISVGNGGSGINVLNRNTINNSGTLTVGNNGAGIVLRSDNTIVNTGTITAGAFGFTIATPSGGGNRNAVLNSGTLDGRIFLVSDGFIGSSNFLTNQGLITISNAGTPPTSHQVEGSFTQTATGVMALRVGPGNSDRFLVLGDGPTDRMRLGGTLRAVLQPGTYQNTQTFTGIVAFNPCNCGLPMEGTFASVTTTSAFFTATAAYNLNSVDLTLNRIPYHVAATTPNQSSIGRAIEGTFSSNLAGNAALFHQNLLLATSAGALDQLSAEGTTAAQSAAIDAGSLFNRSMMGQGAFWFTGETTDANGVSYAANAYASERNGHDAFSALNAPPAAAQAGRWRVWTVGFGSNYSLGGEAAAGSTRQTYNGAGGAFGVDHQLQPDLLLGFAVSGTQSAFAAPSLSTSGRTAGGHIGVYGIKRWGALYTSAALSYARFDTSTSRTIVGIGPTENTSGGFASDQISARFEMGWRHRVAAFNVTPFVAVEPAALRQNGYLESSVTGTGTPALLALNFAGRTITSLPTFVGVQFDTRVATGHGMVLSPFARLSWVHEFSPDRSIAASFVTLPLASFTVQGPRAAGDSAMIDAGATLALTKMVSLFSSVTGEFSPRSQGYAGRGGLRVAW